MYFKELLKASKHPVQLDVVDKQATIIDRVAACSG